MILKKQEKSDDLIAVVSRTVLLMSLLIFARQTVSLYPCVTLSSSSFAGTAKQCE